MSFGDPSSAAGSSRLRLVDDDLEGAEDDRVLLGDWCFSRWGPFRPGLLSDAEVMLEGMTLGLAPPQADMFATTITFCEPLLRADSIYALLHRERL